MDHGQLHVSKKKNKIALTHVKFKPQKKLFFSRQETEKRRMGGEGDSAANGNEFVCQ
jgi:hypothetical protein